MQKIFSKKLLFLIPIFVFLGLFLFGTNQAKAQLGGIIADAAMDLLQGVFYLLQQLGGLFAGFCGNLFTTITRFGFDNMDVVKIGWTITRDIVNMFFILGLVVIAFATILRIETYGMKALLPKFIIVALLINFSYLICGIIIDASQVVVIHFSELISPENQVDVGLQILDVLQVQDTITGGEGGVSVAIGETNPEVATTITMGFNAAILFVAGFVLLVGTILLFLRVGAIWVLIILAPFAWFFSIFPGLKTHADRWWSEFLKWVFFAPVYIFFIYLVLQISRAAVFDNVPDSPSIVADMTISPMLQDLSLLFQYVFLVVLLLGAPTVAMSMGIKAAGAVKTFTKGALKGTARLPLRLQKVAATMAPPAWMEKKAPPLAKLVRGIQKTAAFTSPEFWKKAIEARKAERRRKARVGYIIGKQQDILNLVYSLGSEKTSFAEQAEQFEVAEKKKDVEAETKRVGSRLIAKLKEALKQKDVLTYKACTELLGEQGDINDAMIFSDMFDDLKFDDKYALDKLKGQNVNDKTKRRFSNLGFKHGVIQQMRQMGLSDKQIAPFLGKMQEIELGAGYYGGYGMAKTDDKGNMIIASDEDQIKTAAAKVKTMTARIRTSKMHGTTVGMQGVDEKGQYEFVGRDDVDDELLRTFTLADVDKTNMEYVRPDTQTLINQAHKKGAMKEISTVAAVLGKKISDAIEGKTEKEIKKEVKEGAKKTKEEVKKELEDLGLK